MFQKITKKLLNGNPRSVLAKKNIIASFGLRFISISVSFLLVPLTINYINPTQYGIWLALSSIIGWVSFFDFGFAHGFRNRFAEAIANNDITLAKKYVSTTYAILFFIFSIIFIIIYITNHYVSWSQILNIDDSYNVELSKVFIIITLFFCISIVAKIINIMLTALQKPAFASVIDSIGQVFSLIVIYILTQTTTGSLYNLALFYSSIPCVVAIIASFCIFHRKQYSLYKPSFNSIDFSLTKNILGLGIQFFIIQLCCILSLQAINIVISRILGPDAVTSYNVGYKYFGILYMIVSIIITPFWSAFTDAYAKGDKTWMLNITKKLIRLWYICLFVSIPMLLLSKMFIQIWLNKTVHLDIYTSISLTILILMTIRGNIFMYLINGIGKIRVQLIIYVGTSIISIPLMVLMGNSFGLPGIIIVPSCIFLIQALVCQKQLNLLIDDKAKGWWNK